jgi:RNA polymerase primary sigma factor
MATKRPTPNEGASRRAANSPSFIHYLTRQRLLTSEEEVDLARRAQQGDAEARTHLIEANMRLVINIAKHYTNAFVPFEDLVQEGSIGLMTACQRFDPSKGYRFSTYATHWIRQAISRAIDNKARTIRVPAHVSETLKKIERVRLALIRAAGEDPTIEQIAQVVGVAPRKVAAYLQAGQDPVSLDMLVGDEERTSLGALLDDKSAVDPASMIIQTEVVQELEKILDSLNERERTVMRRRFGFDDEQAHVLQDIGEELQISRERVRQIEAQALRRLRQAAQRRHLREYLIE